MCNKEGRFNACDYISTILCLLFAIAVGIFFSLGFLTLIATVVRVVLIFGAAALFTLAAGAFLSAIPAARSSGLTAGCIGKNIGTLLTGAIGTILAALAASAIVLVPALVVPIILVAATAFFFAFLLYAIAKTIVCLISDCRGNN